MIEVHYDGGMAVTLFQYCFGRVLATHLGYALKADPIAGFPGTQDEVKGESYPDGEEVVLTGHEVDISALIADKRPRKIILNGCFQRYEYYEPFRDQIRQWMQPENCGDQDVGPCDLVMHVRRGDYLRAKGYPLPFSYYEDVLNGAQYERLVICTDGPEDPFFRKFSKYNPVIKSGTQFEDFCTLHAGKKIAISQSTFSWWAAFLSDATEIYFPLSLTGPFSDERPDIDLRVPEDRFIYIKCKEKYQFSTYEKLRQCKAALKFRMKRFILFFIRLVRRK